VSLPPVSLASGLPELTDREFLDRTRDFLQETHIALREEQRLRLDGGIAACRKYSDVIDSLVTALYARGRARFLSSAPDMKYRMTVIAVGGYGRGELCPKSDVDLLFLYRYKVDRYVESVTESILYPLWDLGLEVGHSVRNVKEAIRLGSADDSIRSSLLDYRYVAGDPGLLAEDSVELDRFVYYAEGDRFIDRKIEEMRLRHEKIGSTVYLLEPNVKDGRGGLRDLQTAVWTARVKYKCRNLSELRKKGVVDVQAVEGIRHVMDYLLRIRNELHYLRDKKSDVLSFESQELLAEMFRYRKQGASLGVERFMKAYYLHAASAAALTQSILEEVGRPLPEEGPRKSFFSLKRKWIGEGGILYKGKLQVRDGTSLEKEPIRILEFFQTMQKTKSSLSLQAKKTIQFALPVIGEEFRRDRAAAGLFMEILADPVHLRETLLAMNDCLFLGRFIPEFAPLHCRVLRDIYHVYTADIHSIRCASVLARIVTSTRRSREEEEFHRIYQRVQDKELLTLAILLHDIGKGKGHGHSKIGAEIVARIGARWGFREDRISDLVFLVERHLLMAHVSQQRDLHDIELILSFTETVQTAARLDMLYLLTYADMKEVGPDVWTQWKAMLLNELYEKGRNVLEQGAFKHPFEERAFLRRRQVQELLKDEPGDSGAQFVARVDDRYLLATPDIQFAEHCRLLARFDGKTPLVETVDTPQTGVTAVIVVCPDERGLFARIAGTLSANGLNILNASVSTTVDGVALDTFYVNWRGQSLHGDPKKGRVIAELIGVLGGRLSVEALIADPKVGKFVRDKIPRYRPTRVNFDNTASSRYTVVDVFTYDRIGLLYDITSALFSLGIDIHLSKISTKADQVADAFYLSDKKGGKITDPARQEEVRRAVLQAIGA